MCESDITDGHTGHVESVVVRFDPQTVSYAQLVRQFVLRHKPVVYYKNGPQRWYLHPAMLYTSEQQRETARRVFSEIDRSHVFKRKIESEIIPAVNFWMAPEVDQRYEEKGGLSMCRAPLR